MEFTIHLQVLLTVFLISMVMGAVANKTRFCTMGAVSDWINIGDTGRMRAWLLSMAVAIAGVLILQATGQAAIGTSTFPPYRTPNFVWLRYVLGGFMFGVGMTLGSGCGSKTLIRVGGGNLKSLVVYAFLAISAYMTLRGLFGQFRVRCPWKWYSPPLPAPLNENSGGSSADRILRRSRLRTLTRAVCVPTWRLAPCVWRGHIPVLAIRRR
jgi:hypothetical protein